MSKEGWTWLYNAKKEHYFKDGRSLCGRWAVLGDPGFFENSDNTCKTCLKKLEKIKGKSKVNHKEILIINNEKISKETYKELLKRYDNFLNSLLDLEEPKSKEEKELILNYISTKKEIGMGDNFREKLDKLFIDASYEYLIKMEN